MTNSSKQYTPMTITNLGTVAELTLGNGGSSIDGTGTLTQRGQGNDGPDNGGPGGGNGGFGGGPA